MNASTLSLHKIKSRHYLPFSAVEYSKFKFGDKDIARKFGHDLANDFIRYYTHSLPRINQIVVISSPYCFIPTATFAMKDYFVQTLNKELVFKGHKPVQETKIHRTITYKEDYGNLDAEERMALIGRDGFHIDKGFIEGKTLLFLDDVKISGSHENVIKRMLDKYGIDNDRVFVYFAELVNKEIHPNIENELNYAFVKSLLHLDKIIKNENFLINTRVVKYILNSDHEEFKTFIQYQPLRFVSNLFDAAIGNSYHDIEDYAANLQYIQKMIE